MKSIYKSIYVALTSALLVGGLTSCEEYLDKEPDSDVNPQEAFKNFTNFQGYVEEMYLCIPTKACHYWNASFNFGEDEIYSQNCNVDFYVNPQMDKGNFKSYYTAWGGCFTYLYGNNNDHGANDRFKHHIWNDAWYCIRKCNLGLENMDLMTNATEEERNFIKGQLYFFRGWWYEEMFQWFGGLPYLDRVPSASEALRDPRISAQECAKLAANDFIEAAKYLPADWDNSKVGKKTSNANQLRVTKATALGYAGKCLLFAASPLYDNGAETGGAKTYSYNAELAKQAAEQLGSCLALVESGATPYELAGFYPLETQEDFNALYNHDRSATGSSCFSDIFYTVSQGFKQPGSVEAMLRGTTHGQANDARWGFACTWGSNVDKLGNGTYVQAPTANYVDYAYGMANGKPAYIVENGQLVPNTAGGFDPSHPFKDRDPRFYHDLVFDGEMYINGTPTGFENQKYATLYTGGIMRDDAKGGSPTGYFCQKYVPHTANTVDKVMDDWGKGFKVYIPYMRLAEIYLMYAEAGAAVQGAAFKSSSYSKTAEEAINVLRDRVGVAHVDAAYTGDQKKFMDEVRRERACELAFEGYRFNDLQRWLLLTEAPYTLKTALSFDRVQDAKWYEENDPREAEVKNLKHETLVTRMFGTKHYWLPILESEVYIYEDFNQNPGW